jgi:hypothetical protein
MVSLKTKILWGIPQEDGPGTRSKSGTTQHWHAYHDVSPAQAGHHNNAVVPRNTVFDPAAAMAQGVDYGRIDNPADVTFFTSLYPKFCPPCPLR